jgi:hypothetical protein
MQTSWGTFALETYATLGGPVARSNNQVITLRDVTAATCQASTKHFAEHLLISYMKGDFIATHVNYLGLDVLRPDI